MSKFRVSILIIGMLVIIVAASLLTVLALYATGAVVTDKIELVYAVFNEEKVYDGTPLVAEHYELLSGRLLEGHYALVEFVGSQTEAGESKSSLSVKICDENGYDVTREYKIGVNRGSLKVLQRDISVALNDEEVVYNGTKVSFNDYTVKGELVVGHTIAWSQPAQLITVNDRLPYDLKPVVFDSSGNEVTKNYNVSFTMGDIRVVPRPVTVKPKDIIKVYDGLEVSVGEVEITEGSLAEGQYFKNIEINNGVTKFNPDVCDRVTRITEIAIFQMVGSNEVDVTENYALDFYTETGVVRIDKRPLTVTGNSGSWVYDGAEHDLTSYHTLLSYEGLAPGEMLLSVDYSGSIRNVGVETNYISALRFSDNASEDNYEITYIHGTLTVTKRTITVITPNVICEYDGTAHRGVSEDDVITSEPALSIHKIVPDEESIKELTECGTISNVMNFKIVAKDDASEQDLSENYDIIYNYGSITVNKRIMEVRTPTVREIFDGEAHFGYETADDIETERLLEGHRIAVPEGTDRPFQVNTGIKYNIFAISVFDAEDNEVTQNYEIDFKYGYIEVSALNIKVKTKGETQEYNGESLKRDDTEFINLPSTITPVLVEEKYPEISAVGREENRVTFNLYYGGAEIDKKNYAIEYEYGWLEITPCTVRLQLQNLNKKYDGEQFVIDFDDALAGNPELPAVLTKEDLVLYTLQQEVVDAGSYAYSVKLAESQNPANFDLKINDGIITIEKYTATITLPVWTDAPRDQEFPYNGLSQLPDKRNVVLKKSLDEANLSYDDITVVAINANSVVNAREELYYYTVQIINGKSKNYDITFTEGSLKIIPCPVTVKLKDYNEPYNGKERSVSWDDITVDSSVNDINSNPQKYLELYCPRTIKDADTYTYELRFIYSEDRSNFELVKSADSGKGEFVVTKVGVTVTSGGALKKVYDGKVYTIGKDDINVSTGLECDYTYTVDAQTASASVSTYYVSLNSAKVKLYHNGEDITRNLNIAETSVSVKIEARSITYTLDNYFCTSSNKPNGITDAMKGCLHVSDMTPLLNGFHIEFDAENIMEYNRGRNTITVESFYFRYIRIYNENNEDVTDNFIVTNEEDLVSSVIIIDG